LREARCGCELADRATAEAPADLDAANREPRVLPDRRRWRDGVRNFDLGWPARRHAKTVALLISRSRSLDCERERRSGRLTGPRRPHLSEQRTLTSSRHLGLRTCAWRAPCCSCHPCPTRARPSAASSTSSTVAASCRCTCSGRAPTP